MKRLLISTIALALSLNLSHAASFTVPSFTLTGPLSTGTVCTPTAAASGPAIAAPAGTIMFNCIVSPVGWQGGVTLNDSNLVVTGLVVPSTATTPTFSLALTAAGVIQTYPAATGNGTTP